MDILSDSRTAAAGTDADGRITTEDDAPRRRAPSKPSPGAADSRRASGAPAPLEGADEQRAATLVSLAAAEVEARRHDPALKLLDEAAPLVEAGADDYLKGCFHRQRAAAFLALADVRGDAGLRERALVEHAAAAYHFEQSGHTREQALAENDLAALYNHVGRREEARRHLARARTLFVALEDAHGVARCDDTLACILTAEGQFEEAEGAASSAVRVLEGDGGQAVLSGALTTLGVAQARLGRYEDARRSLSRAALAAEAAGDRAAAGAAALALAEELAGQMSSAELCESFAHAHDLLAGTHDPETLARLSKCAVRAVGSLSSPRGAASEPGAAHGPAEQRWKGFSLKEEVLRYESDLITRALHDADGVVSRAAKLLGFKHHQTFVALLNNRHKGLLHARSPIVPRRRSLLRPRDQRRTPDRHGD